MIHLLAEFLFWFMALLFVLFVAALSFGAFRERLRRRRDERWVGEVLRDAWLWDPSTYVGGGEPGESYVFVVPNPYDWSARGDFPE